MKMTLVLIAIVLLVGCQSDPTAIVPDELSLSYNRGVLEGAESIQETSYPPYYRDAIDDDQDLWMAGIGLTWHLKKAEARELRTIRELLERMEAKR